MSAMDKKDMETRRETHEKKGTERRFEKREKRCERSCERPYERKRYGKRRDASEAKEPEHVVMEPEPVVAVKVRPAPVEASDLELGVRIEKLKKFLDELSFYLIVNKHMIKNWADIDELDRLLEDI